MALTSTMHRFAIELSDVDRGVYESFEVPLALHPSESVSFAVVRLLAFALEYRDQLAFGRGIGAADEPAISAPGLHGTTALWVDIGAPSADRLHKAAKRADDVAVYSHRDPVALRQAWSGTTIHRADALRLVHVDQGLVDALGERLERRNAWQILRTEGVLYVTVDGDTFEGPLVSGTVGG